MIRPDTDVSINKKKSYYIYGKCVKMLSRDIKKQEKHI